LANSFHKLLNYQKCLQQFIEVENEHKDNLRQQGLAFLVKQLKEFNISNAIKIETIKWEWNLLWHIVTNDECSFTIGGHDLLWTHFVKEAKFISSNLI
jgi:hypothetical protein